MTSEFADADGLAPRWRRRNRLIDWLLVVATTPFTILFTFLPGGVTDADTGGLQLSEMQSLAYRFIPSLLPSDDDIHEYDQGWAAIFANPAFGLFVVLVVPALTALGILFRRTRPQLLLAIAAALLLAFGNFVPTAVAMYSYAAWFTDRRRLVYWCATAFAATVISYWDWRPVLMFAATVGTPMSLGLWTGTRRELIASLRERTERLEREQRLMAERAAAAERTRIAREMHDVVAHRVSQMVLQAGGLEVSAADADTSRTATRIRRTGREALTELREVLGVLRDNTESDALTAPQPVLADLDRLVDGWRSAGMTIRRDHSGTARPLPERVERTAYRVLQEALTNAGRHAPGHSVWIRLDFHDRALEVSATSEPPENDPTPADAVADRAPSETGGYGLAGLRERVAIAGGVLTAGALPGGGWRVHASLPVDSGPREAAPDASDHAMEQRT